MNITMLMRCLSEEEKREIFSLLCDERKKKSLLNSEGKTTIKDFISEVKLSARLHNVLAKDDFQKRFEIYYVEDISEEDFLKIRNAGSSAWIEFEVARGKYLANKKEANTLYSVRKEDAASLITKGA